MRMTPRVIVKKLIRRWSISSSARCCDMHALLMISWFTPMSQKNVSDNGSDWCSDTTRRRSSSDHLPIITIINIRYEYRQHQNRRTFTNYKKTEWTQFTDDTLSHNTIPINIHTANIICTNIILMTEKHNILKGKMHSNCKLLLEHIVCIITQRHTIRRENSGDPALKLLKEEITT